jgi:hypothetical protein
MPNGARSCAIITPPCIAHKTHTHTITHTYLTHHAQRCTKLRKKNTTMHSTKNTHKHKHTQTHTHTSRIMPNVARSCALKTPPCIAHKTHKHTNTHTYLTHHAQRCTKLHVLALHVAEGSMKC